MKFVKHDVVQNYLAFSDTERDAILIDEISKSIMVFPKSVKDILISCDIHFENNSPENLLKAIKANGSNLKMIHKLAKIMLVCNYHLQNKSKEPTENVSFRELMNDKKDFLNQNADIFNDSVFRMQKMFKSKKTKDELTKSVYEYLNMDGNSEQTLVSIQKKSWLYENKNLLLGIGIIGLGIYIFSRKK